MHSNAHKAILLLHGWGTNGGVFIRQSDCFKDDFTLITPDIYGMLTGNPQAAASIDGIAALIVDSAALHEFRQLFIVGWSFGGALALKIQKKLADRVCGIVLCGFCPVFVKSNGNPYGISSLAVKKLINRLDKSPETAIGEFVRLVLFGQPGSADYKTFINIVSENFSEDRKKALFQTLLLLKNGNFTNDVKAVTTETLIIHATGDKLCQSGAVENMSKLIKNCRLKFIDGSTHASFFTDYEKFNKILKEFILSVYERED